jgi:hypothetical protein
MMVLIVSLAVASCLLFRYNEILSLCYTVTLMNHITLKTYPHVQNIYKNYINDINRCRSASMAGLLDGSLFLRRLLVRDQYKGPRFEATT